MELLSYPTVLTQSGHNMFENNEIVRGTPGLIGAISAMLWLKETWLRRASSVIAGSAASYYGTPFGLTLFSSLDSNLMGFLIGLFGMAIAIKLFETLEQFPTKSIVDRVLTKLGL